MSGSPLPNAREIREWIGALDQREAELDGQIAPLLAEQAANRERRRLLSDLLASFGEVETAAVSPTAPPDRESVRERVRRQVRLVLEEAGEPLHINDIHREFVRRGFEVPGQGRAANITAHLGGNYDIVSPNRGVYALESLTGPVTPKPVKKRRSTKRRK